ncbi:MAG: CBM21 domain-containing protein [Chitinispirillales bacterium]|jgi:hypothetical protein|nr:CBM21 domain-containing protein [Chitinispirillales bacterium]
MKSKKISSLMFSVVMFAAIFIAAPFASAAQVELMFAKSSFSTPNVVTLTGLVEVENLGYVKEITFHYTFDNGPNWENAPASYKAQTHGNKEAWEFSFVNYHYNMSGTVTFAIKYRVNGQDYWDNNHGKNYEMKLSEAYHPLNYIIGNAGVKVVPYGSAYSPHVIGNVFSGYIIVKDIGSPKTLEVYYTTNNWSLSSVVSATKNSGPYSNGLEVWHFSAALPPGWAKLQYKVSLGVNNIIYTDDNFGAYYVIYP